MTVGTPETEEKLNTCFEAVEARCAERGLKAVRLANVQEYAGYLGIQLQGATRTWDLYVDANESALKLPRLVLRSHRGLLAHVGYGGTVCVNDGQGLSLDPERHDDIITHTILAGFDVLEKSAADATSQMTEFFNELEGYWLGLPGSLRGRATFDLDGKDRIVTVHSNEAAKPAKWYVTERGAVPPSEFRAERLTAMRGLYVHLDECPMPPAPPHKLGVDFIEEVHAVLSATPRELWSELVAHSKNGSKRVALLVSVPRGAGGDSLVGVLFGAKRGAIDAEAAVRPITFRRHTPRHMRARGGASLALMGKHVAVLGCGAVGSVVAEALAAAGVGRLTLVDPEDYSEDNVFRHVLSPIWIDVRKVYGLRVEFERRYPGIQVAAVPDTAQTWIETANLADLDGVVVAFGAPSVERSFSRYFRRKAAPFPVVFTWLEALDLGGHSVLMTGHREGCLDCLYRDDEGQPALQPRTSFLEPDQHVSRNLTGCSSTFVPFGALQAHRTGLLAAEHLLGGLNADAKASYRFWIGDGTIAADAGLVTTNWWKTAGQTSPAEATSRVFGRPCRRCRGST